jgi:threonine/homoserine/homoserine lactone efflux protein
VSLAPLLIPVVIVVVVVAVIGFAWIALPVLIVGLFALVWLAFRAARNRPERMEPVETGGGRGRS